MTADPDNEWQVGVVARIAYAWSFGAHNGGIDWDRTMERAAKDSESYSARIIDRCISQARHVLTILRDDAS